MFYVTGNQQQQGPFKTYKLAAYCARTNAVKYGATFTITKQAADAVVPGPVADYVITEPTITLATLWDQLDTHDWFYAMSDDHRVWQRGERERNRLIALAATIPGGDKLMDEFLGHVASGEPWGNTKQPKPTRPAS